MINDNYSYDDDKSYPDFYDGPLDTSPMIDGVHVMDFIDSLSDPNKDLTIISGTMVKKYNKSRSWLSVKTDKIPAISVDISVGTSDTGVNYSSIITIKVLTHMGIIARKYHHSGDKLLFTGLYNKIIGIIEDYTKQSIQDLTHYSVDYIE